MQDGFDLADTIIDRKRCDETSMEISEHKRIRLIWDEPGVGYDEVTVFVLSDAHESFIRSLFERILGVPYNEYCRYEEIPNNG